MTRSPLRITIAQGAFLPVPPLLGGAVEKVWYALGQEFARRGHQVIHVGRAHEKLPANERMGGVEYRRVRGYGTPRAMWRLKLMDLLYSRRVRSVLPPADILITNTFWLPLIERRRSRGRTYIHVGRYPKGQLRWYPRDAVLQTVSEPIRQAILREVPENRSRVRVIPYPLAPVYLGERGSSRNVILYTGRIHPEKGLHLLIAAFEKIVQAGTRDWTLRLVGPWRTEQGGGGAEYRERLMQAANSSGGLVEFVEPLFDEQKLVAEYRGAAIFAYPSLAEFGETFGLAVLEAMASGCVPVVSALGCFADFVEHGSNGLIFDHRASDPVAQLVGVLQKLLESIQVRDRLREAAWQTARAYALPEIADQFLEDFLSLVKPATSPQATLQACLPR